MPTLTLLYKHRALVRVLVGRELSARYRGSALGFLWSLLNPLLMLGVYTLVFQVLMPSRAAATSPYALFLFSGLLPWNFFSASLTDSADSLLSNGALLKKVLFPAEVLPTVSVLAQGVHFLLALPVLLGALVLGTFGVFGAPVTLTLALLQAPLLLLLQGILLLGLGYFLSALTVHFRDVKDLLGTALAMLFFATPILYDLQTVKPESLASLLAWNPLAILFTAWRDAFFFGKFLPLLAWVKLAAFSGAAFFLGATFFDRVRDTLPEAV